MTKKEFLEQYPRDKYGMKTFYVLDCNGLEEAIQNDNFDYIGRNGDFENQFLTELFEEMYNEVPSAGVNGDAVYRDLALDYTEYSYDEVLDECEEGEGEDD